MQPSQLWRPIRASSLSSHASPLSTGHGHCHVGGHGPAHLGPGQSINYSDDTRFTPAACLADESYAECERLASSSWLIIMHPSLMCHQVGLTVRQPRIHPRRIPGQAPEISCKKSGRSWVRMYVRDDSTTDYHRRVLGERVDIPALRNR